MNLKNFSKKIFKISAIALLTLFIILAIAGYFIYRFYIYGVRESGEMIKGASQIELINHRPALNDHFSAAFNKLYDHSGIFSKKISNTVIVDSEGITLSPDKNNILFFEAGGSLLGGEGELFISVYNLKSRKKTVINASPLPERAEWLMDNSVYIEKSSGFLRLSKEGNTIDYMGEGLTSRIFPGKDRILYSSNNKNFFIYRLDRTMDLILKSEDELQFKSWSPDLNTFIFDRWERLKNNEGPKVKHTFFAYDVQEKKLIPIAIVTGGYGLEIDFEKKQGFPETPTGFWLDNKKIKLKISKNFQTKILDPSMIEVETRTIKL